jgi:hypothetical protein
MDLDTVHTMLQKIIVSANNPADSIDNFLIKYWSVPDEELSFDSEVWKAIHDLAHELEYYESNPDWREHGLFGEEEAIKKIQLVIDLIKKSLAA